MSERIKILVVVVFITIACIMVSCKNVDSQYKILAGKWQLTSINDITPSYGYVIEFNEKAQGKVYKNESPCHFNYSLKGKSIVFKSDNEDCDSPFINGNQYEIILSKDKFIITDSLKTVFANYIKL